MKKLVLRSLFVLSLFAAAMPFCGVAHADNAVAAASSPDEELAARVKATLDAQPELQGLNLKVTSKNAEVTVAGTVDSGEQLYKAGVTAEKVPGVKYVINDMHPKK